MLNRFLTLISLLTLSLPICADEKGKNQAKVWTDPAAAAAEHPSFNRQGEYAGEKDGKKIGVQVAAMKDNQFLVLTYQGGLPNEGWDKGALISKVVPGTELDAVVAGLEKQARTSPTMGQKAPEGAIVVFNGEANPEIKGEIKDGLLWPGSNTTQPVKDFQLHIEFRLPFKPDRTPSSQDRGNSGLYLFNSYEVQVLDSFGLDFKMENNPIKLESDNKQWCGCFYKTKIPDMPMAYPPLAWQTYDIDFTAPRFEGEKKVANARATIRHNGVLIHDNVELTGGTGAGAKRPETPEGLIYIQGHGNPTAFRNFWIVKK